MSDETPELPSPDSDPLFWEYPGGRPPIIAYSGRVSLTKVLTDDDTWYFAYSAYNVKTKQHFWYDEELDRWIPGKDPGEEEDE